MNKYFTTFLTLSALCASVSAQSFKVNYDDKNYKFPLESEITISSDDDLIDVTTLVEPVSLSNTEQYFKEAQVVVEHSDGTTEYVALAPIGDWTFQGSTNTLAVGDKVYVQYRRGTSTMWNKLSAQTLQGSEYPLCQSNRLAMGIKNKLNVAKAPNVVFGKDKSNVTFTLMGCTGSPTLLATGFSVETALVKTVERSLNTKYGSSTPKFGYTTGNTVYTSSKCTLYADSIWMVEINPQEMINSYFTVLDENGKNIEVRIPSYSGHGILTARKSLEFNALPQNLNKTMRILFNENSLEYSIFGFVEQEDIPAVTSVEGSWFYNGEELFTVKDGKLTVSDKFGLENSEYDVTVSEDMKTLTIHPTMWEKTYGKRWLMMGRYDEGYISTFAIDPSVTTNPQKSDVYAALKDATFSVSDDGLVCDNGFQFFVYVIASESSTAYTSFGNGTIIMNAGTKLYKK